MFLWTLQFHSEARMERKKPFTISAIFNKFLAERLAKSRRKERNRADDLW